MDTKDIRTGIVFYKGKLLYGFNDGVLLWAPFFFKNILVSVFNTISCFFIGHDRFVIEEEGSDVCLSCCKEFEGHKSGEE